MAYPISWLPESPINSLEGGALTIKKPLNEPTNPIIIKVWMSTVDELNNNPKANSMSRILMATLAVIPSILSNIFNEFIKPITHTMVSVASIQ